MSVARFIFSANEIALFNSPDFTEESSISLKEKQTMFSLYFSVEKTEDEMTKDEKTQAKDKKIKKPKITEENIKAAFVDASIRSQAERLTQDNTLKGNDINLLLPVFFCYALRNKEALLIKLATRLFRNSNLKDEVKPLLSKILNDNDFVKIGEVLSELRFSFNIQCSLDQFKSQLNSLDNKLAMKKAEATNSLQSNVATTTKPTQPAALQKLPSDNKLAVKKTEATNSLQSNVATTTKPTQPAALQKLPSDNKLAVKKVEVTNSVQANVNTTAKPIQLAALQKLPSDNKLAVKKTEATNSLQPNVATTTKPTQPAALQKLPSDNKLAVKKAEATNSVQPNVNTITKPIQPTALIEAPTKDLNSINEPDPFVNSDFKKSGRGNRYTSLYLQDRKPSDLSKKEKKSKTLTPGKLRKMGFQYASEGNVYQQLSTQEQGHRRRPSK